MCTCGNTEPHVVARKTTLDGAIVEVYSDGYVTSALGYLIQGVGRKRLPESRLFAFAGEVCILNVSELGATVVEHQKAAKAEATASVHVDAIRNVPAISPMRIPSKAEQAAKRAAWRR